MAKYLPLPDGNSVKIREGETPNDAWERAKAMYPASFGFEPPKEEQKEAGPQSGFTPALKAGVSGLKGDIAALAGKTGLMDEAAAEKKIKEEEAYRAKTFKPTQTWGEAPVTKGLELLGGSLPYMAAPVAAGFLAPEGAAALGATGLASLAQFTGSNLSRQMDEGKTLKETELGSAAAAAIPQAALDVVSLKMIPGVRNIFGQAGKKMTSAEAKAFAEQGLAKIAGDYALATGKSMGTEGLTEAGQQLFERMQAGLSLTDDKARTEYWDSLVGGAVLGGALSPAGRFVERGNEKAEAKSVLAKEKRDQELAARQAASAQRKAEIAAEAARKETPEYMDEIESKYKSLLDQKAQLDAVADGATTKGDLAAEEAKRLARKQREELMGADETKALLSDYIEVQARRKAMPEKLAPNAPIPTANQQSLMPETGVGGNLPDAAAIQQAEQERGQYGAQANPQAQVLPQVPTPPSTASVQSALPEPTTDYAQQARALKTQIEPLQELLQKTTNLQKKIEIGQQIAGIRTAITEAEKGAKEQVKPLEAQIKSLAYQMSAAEIEGDEEAQTRIAKKLMDLGVEDLSQVQAQTPFDLKATKKTFSESTEAFNQRAADAIASGREEERARQNRIEAEKARIANIGERYQPTGEEYTRDARQEHQVGKEVLRAEELSAMDRKQTAQESLFTPETGSRPQVRTDAQGNVVELPGKDLTFGESLSSTQRSGSGAFSTNTRARLQAALQIARATGNRAAVADAVAALKDLKAKEEGAAKAQPAFNFAELQKAAGTTAPANVAAQQEATDRRDTAYGNLVDIVSKYNQGKAKKEAVDRARDFLLENLAKDIETSRGRPLTTAEQLKLQNQANGLLDDLVARFGDTRNVSSVGTKRDPAFLPAQDEKGEFNKEAGPNMGYFTAESKGPGYRTFSSPYAAAMSIQEGLDSIRNQGVAGQFGASTTEITRTPTKFTPEMVKNQLDRLLSQAPEKTDPEVRKRAVQIADSLKAFGKNIDAISEYLSNPTPERTREVDALLADTERAKRSETADQTELPGVEAPKVDTAAEQQRKQRERDQKALYAETIYDREERDRTLRRLENEMRDRLEAIPGERLDFSKRREMLDVVDSARETEDEINQNITDAERALEQIAKNIEQQQTVIQDSQVTIDVLKPKKRLGSKQTVDLARAEQNLTDAKAALKKSEIDKRTFEAVIDKGNRAIASLSRRVEAIGKAFTNDPEALKKLRNSVAGRIKSREKKIADLSKKLNSLRDVEKNKEKRTQLKHELAKKKREIRELQTLIERERGLERTPVGATPALRAAEEADLETVEAEPAKVDKSNILSRTDLLEQERIVNDPGASAQEQMAARDKIAADEAAGGPASRNLQNRKKGPLVKDVRTGKVTQAGKAKPVTGLQAQRAAAKDVGFEQALLELDRISDLREKLEAAKETATTAKDTARLEKLGAYEKRLDEAQRKQEKALGKFRAVLRTAVSSTGPTLQSGQVTRIANAIVKDWAKVPNIEVVDNVDDLLPRIRDQLLEENGPDTEVPGLYDPDTDTVFLISSALRSGQEVSYTVMHEIAGHYGLRQMLGSTYSKTMNALYNGNKAVKDKADAKLEANKKLTREIAVEEVLADAAENAPYANQQIRNALRRFVAVIKQWLRDKGLLSGVSDFEINQLVADARRYVRQGVGGRGGEAAMSRAVTRTVPKYEEENELTELADKIIAQPKSFMERLGNNKAIEFEMNTADMRAGLREALKAGAEDLGNNDLYTQAMYSVTKADQAMPLIQASLGTGPLEMYQDERGLYGIRSSGKDSAKEVFEAISDLPGENSQAKVALATTYMIAQRAANKGLTALDLGNLKVSQADLDAAMARVQANPALEKQLELVRARYNAYNKGQINFLASTGAITKEFAKDLLKEGDYVPYYRVRSDGTAELVYGNERTITVGDIRHQPYLAELKGGETKILPLDESIMRNTMLITRKGLTNLATRNVAYAMQDFGAERGEMDEKTGELKNVMPIKKGQGPAGNDIIHFNQEPDPNDSSDDGRRWLRVRTEGTAMEGIPAELVVKSLEGAHLTLPAFLKIGGIAGDLLRKGVTRMPMYIMRQLYRDPMAATFTAGLNYNPLTAVMKAGGEFIKMSQDKSTTAAKLMEKGLIQSNLFTGDPDDMSTFALQLASGKDLGAINRVLAFVDRAAMRADSATRALVYENALKNGLSEVEADMMVMESMNFYKRGLSPTIQYANRLIPFMNAQIQGLNVLVKAARGNMPFEEQLQIKRKFMNNAMLLAATGVLYAMAMEDDDYFKNAKPRDKYSNMFLHLPGVEEPMKIAIPYEAGWFYSAGVAMVDALREKSDGAQQWKAVKDMFLSAVPGYTSGFMPQAVKPIYEVWSNKNLFSGQNIEPMSVRDRLPEDRYVAATTEVSKALAKVLPGVSPMMLEHLARSYFGTLPLVAMASANALFDTGAVEPTKRASEQPLVGSAFQKKYGGADMDVVYDLSKEALQTKASYNDLRKTGTPEQVREFAMDHRAALAAAPIASAYQTNMGRLRIDQDRVRNRTDMSEGEKRARIDALDGKRQEITELFMARLKQVEDRFGKTTPR